MALFEVGTQITFTKKKEEPAKQRPRLYSVGSRVPLIDWATELFVIKITATPA